MTILYKHSYSFKTLRTKALRLYSKPMMPIRWVASYVYKIQTFTKTIDIMKWNFLNSACFLVLLEITVSCSRSSGLLPPPSFGNDNAEAQVKVVEKFVYQETPIEESCIKDENNFDIWKKDYGQTVMGCTRIQEQFFSKHLTLELCMQDPPKFKKQHSSGAALAAAASKLGERIPDIFKARIKQNQDCQDQQQHPYMGTVSCPSGNSSQPNRLVKIGGAIGEVLGSALSANVEHSRKERDAEFSNSMQSWSAQADIRIRCGSFIAPLKTSAMKDAHALCSETYKLLNVKTTEVIRLCEKEANTNDGTDTKDDDKSQG